MKRGDNPMPGPLKSFLIITVISFFAFSHFASAEQANLAPLGFTFGISEKDAKKIIESRGKRIMNDDVDSKKIRTIQMQGIITELPLDLDGKDVSTGLEFYDKKLLSSALILAAKDSLEEREYQKMLSNYLTETYGNPASSDSMLYFKTWTWHIPDVRIVLHTNTQDHTVKMEYTYEPVNQAKREDELNKLRGTEESDPASEMFIDGDYSKPRGYRGY